jgi:hypothetical protein
VAFVKKSTALRNGKLRSGCKTVKTPSGRRYFCGVVTQKVKRARKKIGKRKVAQAESSGKCQRIFTNKRGATLCVLKPRGRSKKTRIVTLAGVKKRRRR